MALFPSHLFDFPYFQNNNHSLFLLGQFNCISLPEVQLVCAFLIFLQPQSKVSTVAGSVPSIGEALHGQYLTVSDHDRLRIFVNEMAVRGLIPHIERSIRALTDQVNSKKGIQRTLYSATKKWFSGGSKPVIMQGQGSVVLHVIITNSV